MAQETGGLILHAATYASAGSDCLSRTDDAAGTRLTVCASANGTSTVDYERHTGSVTYYSAESLYSFSGGQWRVVYAWSNNQGVITGETPDFGGTYTFHATVSDSASVWRATVVVPLAPFSTRESSNVCQTNTNPWGQTEIVCESVARIEDGVRGSASGG